MEATKPALATGTVAPIATVPNLNKKGKKQTMEKVKTKGRDMSASDMEAIAKMTKDPHIFLRTTRVVRPPKGHPRKRGGK